VGLRDSVIAALAFPAVFVNLTHGHNGFLTASLFTGALLCLDARPWLAGMLFGLLA
jgi:alpha-1,2-mannosyltransferase